MSQTLTKPILLDETGKSINTSIGTLDNTGQAIKTALNNINDTESQDWLLSYEDVHSEMDDNVDRIADALEAIQDTLEKSERYPIRITVSTPPTKTSYVVGELLDYTGMVVSALMSNGIDSTLVDVTDQCTITPSNGSVALETISSISIEWQDYKTLKTFTTSQPLQITVASWSTGSDDDIQKMLNAHYNDLIDIHDYWNIGEEREIQIDMTNFSWWTGYDNYERVELVLMGAEARTLSSPINGHTKGAFVVGYKGVMYNTFEDINPTYDYSKFTKGWEDSAIREFLNGTYFENLPIGIQAIAKYHENITSNAIIPKYGDPQFIISHDRVALFTQMEVFGHAYHPSESSEIEQIEYYETAANRVKNHMYKISADGENWTTRTVRNSRDDTYSSSILIKVTSDPPVMDIAGFGRGYLSPFIVI